MAREFNGTSDKIVYGNISGFNGRATLTISMWIYPLTGGSAYGYVLDALGAASGEGNIHGWAFLNNAADETAPYFAFRNGSDVPEFIAGTGSLTASTWQHLYIRYNGGLAADQRLRFWVGGSLDSDEDLSGSSVTTIGTTDAAFQLGVGETTQFWNGRMAEIGIWLDADETRIADMAAGKAPSFYETNLHVYIPLISGDGAVDVRGNAGSPTITGTSEVAHPGGITYPSERTDGLTIFRKA